MLIRFIMLMALNLPGRAQSNEGPERRPGRPRSWRRVRWPLTPDPLARPEKVPCSAVPTKPRATQPARLEHKGPGAKGRPTPTRKEAEAAARERAKAGMDKKAAQKLLRERRAESNAKMRAGMRSGDERYLPARDQGPVKRFVRDYVDARLSIAEFLLPLLLVIMVLQYSGSADLVAVRAASSVGVDAPGGPARHRAGCCSGSSERCAEVPRREPQGHDVLHDHARAPAALAADAQAPGQDRRRPDASRR